MNDPINAEVVESQALAVRPISGLPTVQDLEQQFALAIRQRELLSEYIRKQLVPGKHFYQRGTQKPSLAKEGAEIILLPHNLAPDYEQTGGPDAPPADGKPYQITVKCTLRRKGDPTSFVGSGIGSAGSEKQKKDGTYIHRQEDKYLCHNATLKMAQKSAMIAATINSTAASEFFTQDIEEAEKPEAHPPPPPPPQPKPAVTSTKLAIKPKAATDKTREWFISEIGDLREKATQFLIDLGWIMPNESLEEIPLRYVPVSKGEGSQLEAFKHNLGTWCQDGRAEKPYPANPEPEPTKTNKLKNDLTTEDEAWRTFPMPFGKNAGIALGDLEKNYLFGLWANYTVDKEYKGKPRKAESIEKDEQFRAMLDLAGKHYDFTKKDR